MRIFVIGMPGEGNLGDDLISVLLAKQLTQRWPDAEIGVFHGEHSNMFFYPERANVTIFTRPKLTAWKSYRQRKKAIKDFVFDSELIVIGGGGLFQDSHSLFNIHNWMKYAFLPDNGHNSVWALSVGFGPLNTQFCKWYVRKTLSRFSVIQVRDEGSRNLVEELGYSAIVNTDVISGSGLEGTPFFVSVPKNSSLLGCSIRPWPTMQMEQVVDLISSICHEHEMRPALFVFDYSESNTVEYDYAYLVSSELHRKNINSDIFCYRKDSIDLFAKTFCSVSHGIAGRYHANVLWQKLGISVIPISYAPKVRRLYEEHGGSVLPVNDLGIRRGNHLFQEIVLTKKYSFPSIELRANSTTPTKKGRFFVKTMCVAEFVYATAQFLKRRFKKHFGLPEDFIRDGSSE